MQTKDLSLGHLRSRSIADAIEEIKTLNLEADASAYSHAFRLENSSRWDHQSNPKILSVEKTARALRLVKDLLGKPISYEKSGYYFGVLAFDKTVSEESVLAMEHRLPTIARACDWYPKSLEKNIEAATLLTKNNIEFYISSQGGIRIFCPIDCYIRILYTSDDPKVWSSYGEKQSLQWADRKKIRKVEKKLDKV